MRTCHLLIWIVVDDEQGISTLFRGNESPLERAVNNVRSSVNSWVAGGKDVRERPPMKQASHDEDASSREVTTETTIEDETEKYDALRQQHPKLYKVRLAVSPSWLPLQTKRAL